MSPLPDNMYIMKMYKKAKVSQAQANDQAFQAITALVQKLTQSSGLQGGVTAANFKLLDKNNNGRLSEREVFGNVFKLKLTKLELKILKVIFHLLDNNNDGLSLKEFLNSKNVAVRIFKLVTKLYPKFALF